MSLTDILLNFIRIMIPSLNPICIHSKVRPDVEQAYCPDCGKLIKNEWYITRCTCCGVKMKAMVKNGQIVPQEHYCSNCGNEQFTVEKIEKINFIDIKFAALKQIAEEEIHIGTTTECRQERTIEQPKLLVQYL